MHFTTLTISMVLLALSASTASAKPLGRRQDTGALSPEEKQVAIIKNAVFAWRQDTSAVSAFIDATKSIIGSENPDFTELSSEASRALTSELDELNHKKTLDTFVCGNPDGCAEPLCRDVSVGTFTSQVCNDDLKNANIVLVTQGTFNSVVESLRTIATSTFETEFEIELNTGNEIGIIDNGTADIGGRCAAVLPAIDTYFQQASDYLVNEFGDHSLEGVTATRPAACTASSTA